MFGLNPIVCVVLALFIGGTLGVIIAGCLCSGRARENGWAAAKRQQDYLDEIQRLKEQEKALRSELVRVSGLYKERLNGEG